MEDLFQRFVSKTLNIDESKFAELVKTEEGEFKADALDILLKQDSDRVLGLKSADDEELKVRFDNGYAKAKSEVLKGLEKELKTSFDLTSDNKGIDLVNEIINVKSTSGNSDEITPENVKTSKTYLEMIERKDLEWQGKLEGVETDYKGKLQNFERQGTLSVVNKAAAKIVDGLNPIFSKDPIKASNQKQVIYDRLGKENFKIDNDRITLLDGEGNLLEDEHRNPIKFEDRVKNITTNLYDLNQSKDRSSGGGSDDNDGAGSGSSNTDFNWNGVTPQNNVEYGKFIAEAKSMDEKKAIMKSWQVSQGFE